MGVGLPRASVGSAPWGGGRAPCKADLHFPRLRNETGYKLCIFSLIKIKRSGSNARQHHYLKQEESKVLKLN